jgi:hypothetical protein
VLRLRLHSVQLFASSEHLLHLDWHGEHKIFTPSSNFPSSQGHDGGDTLVSKHSEQLEEDVHLAHPREHATQF